MKVRSAGENLLQEKEVIIRLFAQVKGLHVSMWLPCFHVPTGTWSMTKIMPSRKSKGDFAAPMTLSSQSELTQWVYNILTSTKAFSHGNSDLILTTDASNAGWGAVCGNASTMGDLRVLKNKPTGKLS